MKSGGGRSAGRETGIRILGLDPGTRATGYGVIEKRENRFFFVTCGVIRTSAKMPLPDRLREIHSGVSEVIKEYRPSQAAVEDIFTAVNPRSALKLGHARGVIILAAMEHDLPVHEYSPRSVKQSVTGYGQAPKEQIQHMVRMLLNLSAAPSHDAADALAIALCHASHYDNLHL